MISGSAWPSGAERRAVGLAVLGLDLPDGGQGGPAQLAAAVGLRRAPARRSRTPAWPPAGCRPSAPTCGPGGQHVRGPAGDAGGRRPVAGQPAVGQRAGRQRRAARGPGAAGQRRRRSAIRRSAVASTATGRGPGGRRHQQRAGRGGRRDQGEQEQRRAGCSRPLGGGDQARVARAAPTARLPRRMRTACGERHPARRGPAAGCGRPRLADVGASTAPARFGRPGPVVPAVPGRRPSCRRRLRRSSASRPRPVGPGPRRASPGRLVAACRAGLPCRWPARVAAGPGSAAGSAPRSAAGPVRPGAAGRRRPARVGAGVGGRLGGGRRAPRRGSAGAAGTGQPRRRVGRGA